MRIALLGDALICQKAGVHFYTLNFYEQLMKEFPHHEYFLVLPETYNGLSNAIQIIVPIKSFVPFHQRIRQFIGIPNAVKELKADMAIEPAHFGPFNLPDNISRITIIHDLTPIKFPKFHKSLDVLMHKFLLARILKKAHFIVVNSNTTKADLSTYLPLIKEKIKVVYPSIQKLASSNIDLKERFGIEKKYFLTVGTIEPRKNYLNLIQAFDDFSKKNSDFQLVIAGAKGWRNKELDNYLKQFTGKKNFIFTDYVPREQLMQLYRDCSLFIYGSHYEGFGLPVLEAMSYNKPLILSRVPSLIEIAEGYARFFIHDDVKDMVDNIEHNLEEGHNFNTEQRYFELDKKSKLDVIELAKALGL